MGQSRTSAGRWRCLPVVLALGGCEKYDANDDYDAAFFVPRDLVRHINDVVDVKTIMLAVLNYESALGAFPGTEQSNDGLPPLVVPEEGDLSYHAINEAWLTAHPQNWSWRVHLLPFLEEPAADEARRRLRYFEPFDSEHNTLVAIRYMPDVFLSWSRSLPPGHTNRLGMRGTELQKTILNQGTSGPIGVRDFYRENDGTSLTTTVVLADGELPNTEFRGVLWTDPNDRLSIQDFQDLTTALPGKYGITRGYADGHVTAREISGWELLDSFVLGPPTCESPQVIAEINPGPCAVKDTLHAQVDHVFEGVKTEGTWDRYERGDANLNLIRAEIPAEAIGPDGQPGGTLHVSWHCGTPRTPGGSTTVALEGFRVTKPDGYEVSNQDLCTGGEVRINTSGCRKARAPLTIEALETSPVAFPINPSDTGWAKMYRLGGNLNAKLAVDHQGHLFLLELDHRQVYPDRDIPQLFSATIVSFRHMPNTEYAFDVPIYAELHNLIGLFLETGGHLVAARWETDPYWRWDFTCPNHRDEATTIAVNDLDRPFSATLQVIKREAEAQTFEAACSAFTQVAVHNIWNYGIPIALAATGVPGLVRGAVAIIARGAGVGLFKFAASQVGHLADDFFRTMLGFGTGGTGLAFATGGTTYVAANATSAVVLPLTVAEVAQVIGGGSVVATGASLGLRNVGITKMASVSSPPGPATGAHACAGASTRLPSHTEMGKMVGIADELLDDAMRHLVSLRENGGGFLRGELVERHVLALKRSLRNASGPGDVRWGAVTERIREIVKTWRRGLTGFEANDAMHKLWKMVPIPGSIP